MAGLYLKTCRISMKLWIGKKKKERENNLRILYGIGVEEMLPTQ